MWVAMEIRGFRLQTWIDSPNGQLVLRGLLSNRAKSMGYIKREIWVPTLGSLLLNPGDVTWGQVMSRHGMHTQMIWDTPMLGSNDYNYTSGFQGVDFVHGQKGTPGLQTRCWRLTFMAQPHKIKNVGSLVGYLRNHARRQYEREYCVGRTISTAMDWLETNYCHKSFFLWVDMWDPHEPFDCPWYDYELYGDPGYEGDKFLYPEYGRPIYMTEEERNHLRALYAGNVTLTDRWLGMFFDMAERLGLFRDTMIIWVSDHGHLFGGHDLQGTPGAELGRLYEGTARIPFLVCHPEGLGAGKRISGLVQPPDLLPSILDFLGKPIPDQIQGKSFWLLVVGETWDWEYAFSSRFPPAAGAPVDSTAFDGWVGSECGTEHSFGG